jgi:hypothetical protein
MQASLSMLEAEGFDRIWRARSLDELAAVEVVAGG